MSRRRILLVAAAVTIVGLGATFGAKALTSGQVGGVMPDHITITQAKQDTSGQKVRVGGDVVPGSISWDYSSGSLSFTLKGEGDEVTVSYAGTAPNDFKPGSRLVVAGRYTKNMFVATSLTTTNSPLCRACH